nr:MAG TPA: hypothetical protein [Caudoviricetes sp.]
MRLPGQQRQFVLIMQVYLWFISYTYRERNINKGFP